MTSLFRPYLKRFSRLCFRAPACTRRFNCVVQSLFLCCSQPVSRRALPSPSIFFGVHLRLERCLFYVNNVTSFLRFTPLHDPAVSRPLPTAITTMQRASFTEEVPSIFHVLINCFYLTPYANMFALRPPPKFVQRLMFSALSGYRMPDCLCRA